MSDAFAMMFPGQGSQSVGMCADVYAQFPVVKTTFNQASEALGYDVWALVSDGPADKLNQTEFTQPALLTADVALWRVWCEHNDARPRLMAGHSLGEFAALVAADSLPFEDAVKLVQARGRFMQSAVPGGIGAMAAIIGLDDTTVTDICDSVADGQVLSPANFNSIGQVVIAGHAEAVDRALPMAKEKGAKIAKRIPVSVPSHCALMQPAADALAKMLETVALKKPTIPVIHNVDVSVKDDPVDIKQALIDQLTQPVRWVDTVKSMEAQGIVDMIECGPGKVLTGLGKRITKQISMAPISF